MRFSLGTFVLFILFIASAYTVWWFNDPWDRQDVPQDYQAVHNYWRKLSLGRPPIISPDGTRHLRPADGFLQPVDVFAGVSIWERRLNGRMISRLTLEAAYFPEFSADDEIRYLTPSGVDASLLRIYRRRYPETNLGQLRRPEVCLMLGTLGLLVFRLVSRILKSRARKRA